jgi:hypothetical protein
MGRRGRGQVGGWWGHVDHKTRALAPAAARLLEKQPGVSFKVVPAFCSPPTPTPHSMHSTHSTQSTRSTPRPTCQLHDAPPHLRHNGRQHLVAQQAVVKLLPKGGEVFDERDLAVGGG